MRIDVHSHLIFLDYLKYLAGRQTLPRGVLEGGTYFVSCAGGYQHASPLLHADVDAKLRSMEKLGIGMAVLSHGMPGPELLGGDEADSWAARINDHLASVIAQYPGKFAGWATLGWGSAERTMAEIDRCINHSGFRGCISFRTLTRKLSTARNSAQCLSTWPDWGCPSICTQPHP
jgi:predicted TIM-barrel fold metal-dependent hydrolase